MANVKIRHSRLSRNSSLGMIGLGVITFLFVSAGVGIILMIVGLVMFWFYRRQTRAAVSESGPKVEKGAAL